MFKSIFSLAFGRKILLGTMLAVTVAIASFYGWAYANGKNACTVESIAINIELEKDHAKIEAEVIKLIDPDLDARFNRWVRR